MNLHSDAPSLLSVVIITLNEESRILSCIKSLPKGCEIICLDSGSTDQTQELAKKAGALVSQRPFDNFAAQKNAAIALATRPWILSLDADEVLSPGLSDEIMKACREAPASFDGFRIPRQLIFLGKRLRFGKSRDYPLRLFRNGKGRFSHQIHERLSVRGTTGRLKNSMDHHSYADLTDYFRRFNNYTSRVSANHYENGKAAAPTPRYLLRPWFEFVYRYLIRLGCLDGYPGYCYALLSSIYAFVKYAKLIELHNRKNPAIER